MLRVLAVLLPTMALGACASLPPNQSLVSGASPAAADSLHQEPQSANSLPPGAQGLQSSGPNNKAPNYLGATFGAF